MNPFTWGSGPSKPLALTLTKAQLSYILTRIEGTGINIGCLDIPLENPRPSQLLPKDTSDSLSISSFVSNFSLSPSSWWTRPTPIDTELKYIYSALTKLPALSLTHPPSRVIETNALPLDAFKNLQTLSLQDIDPRSLVGWDRLAEGLRSLTAKRSGMEDVSELIVDAVVEDEERRQKGDLTPIRRKAFTHRPSQVTRPSWQDSLRRTTAIPEEDESMAQSSTTLSPTSSSPSLPKLSPSKWRFLRHLCLADNGLTFFPSNIFPFLTAVAYLDLSNNLLVSAPPGLAELHRLVSLNLAGNMIDSVLGIYTTLGQVHTLNLSSNRLESLCGLERLGGLQRIDLRNNQIEETAEVGRLATLPGIAEVWVAGNPLTKMEEDWRVMSFSQFSKEGKEIRLDDTVPGFLEKGRIEAAVGTPKLDPVTVVSSPRAKPHSTSHSRAASSNGAVLSPALNGRPDPHVDQPSTPVSSPPPPSSSPVVTAAVQAHPKSKKKRQARIVDLGEDPSVLDHMSSGERSPVSLHAQLVGLASSSPSKSQGFMSSPPNDLAEGSSTKTQTNGSSTVTSPREGSPSSSTRPLSPPATNGSDTINNLPMTLGYSNNRNGRMQSLSATMAASTGPMGRNINGRRRARVSASVYEPSSSLFAAGTSPPSASSSPRKVGIFMRNGQPAEPASSELQFSSEADAFRAKVEALRNEVGDSWLKVLTQSNSLATPSAGKAG